MKKVLIAVALSLGTLTLVPACQGYQKAIQDEAILDATIKDEQAFIVALAAYKGALVTVNEALDAGLLVPASETALKVEAIRVKADQVVSLAEKAKAAGDAQGLTARSYELMGLVAQIGNFVNLGTTN